MKSTISEIINVTALKQTPFCDVGTTVFDASVQMALLQVSALAVQDGGKPIGILTFHDVCLCLADSGADFSAQTVEEWMAEKVVKCHFGTRLSTALKQLDSHHVGHLIVMDKDRAVSIVGELEIATSADSD